MRGLLDNLDCWRFLADQHDPLALIWAAVVFWAVFSTLDMALLLAWETLR